ncbi:MAG: ABC transporter substrate-binding protein [SAR324 cluster bacterium]|nr:ABC transporter substrate-binding protein [SAR324 cluster bacterium]
MRKRIAVFTAVLLAATVTGTLIWYYASSPKESTPIRIAINTWPGYSHVFLAQEKGIFKRNGVLVELLHIPEYSDAQEAFKNGTADGVFQVFTDTIMQHSILPSKVVYVSDYSDTADVIVGNVDAMSNLSRRTVGVEGLFTFSHIFVLNALLRAGVSEENIQLEIVPAHEVLVALDQGRIDAGHTWEPTLSNAIDKGYKILAQAGDSPGIIADLLVFRADLIEERPEEIQAIVQSMVEAHEYREEHWDESIRIMAKAVGMSEAEMVSGLRGTKQIGRDGNRDALNKSDAPDSLHNTGEFIVNFFMKRGQLSSIVSFNEIIEPKFVNNLTGK